jgi:sialic acid synthase SpsE
VKTSAAILILAQATVNKKSRLSAALDLVDLVGSMAGFLTKEQRYCVADHLRNLADQTEHGVELDDVTAH